MTSSINEIVFRQKVFFSAIWIMIANVVIRSLQFIKSIILARLLTPEIFGVWGIINFIYNGIETFTQTGFGAELIHRQHRIEEAADVAWTLNVLRGIILSIACYLASPILASFYNRPEIDILLKIVGISFFIKGFSNINIILLRKNLNFKKISFYQQGTELFSFLVTIYFAFALRSVWALVWGTLAYFTADLILSYLIGPRKPQFKLDTALAGQVFRYGIFVTGAGIVTFLSLQLDNAFIGKVLGMEPLGFYVLAYSLANLPTTEITHLVKKVMFPAYSKVQNDQERLTRLYTKTTKLIITMVVPATAGLAFLSDAIIQTVYGDAWMDAAPLLKWLCLYGFLRALLAINDPFFNAIGYPKIPFLLDSTRLALMVVSMYPLAKLYDINGVIYSVILSIAIPVIASFFIIKKYIITANTNIISFFIFPIINSFFMLIILSVLRHVFIKYDVTYLALSIILGCVTYLLSIFFTEKNYLTEIIQLARTRKEQV